MPDDPGTTRGSLEPPWNEYWPDVAYHVGRDGQRIYFRPNQLLAPSGQADAVRADLEAAGWRATADPGLAPGDFVRFDGPPQLGPDAAAEATVRLANEHAALAPNHVLTGEQTGPAAPAITYAGCPRLQGGPADLVHPASRPARPTLPGPDGAGVTVGIVDTGLWAGHPWLSAASPSGPPSGDPWDVDRDTILDAEAGHGTFIAGLILALAPGARIVAIQGLDSQGVADDLGIAAAIDSLPPELDILNLSLGGYTLDGNEPPVLAERLRARSDRTLVLAAAGNDGLDTRFWPAAMEEVIGVGAHGRDGRRAGFSNFGEWVDVEVLGERLTSSFLDCETHQRLSAPAQAAPPEPTTVRFEGYAEWSGSSFAVPLLAGSVAAVMRSTEGGARAAYEALLERTAGPASQPRRIDLRRVQEFKQTSIPSDLL